jgi:hypothetical protein
MQELNKPSNFRNALLAQDSPSPARTLAHREILLTKIRRRLRFEKMLVGSVYIVIFVLGLMSFLQAGHVREAANAVWWAACSMHLLLWCLVFFLWQIERLIDRVLPSVNPTRHSRRESLTVIVAAIAVCALGTGFLVQAAFIQDALRMAQTARYILWCPVYFLFWYPFGIASAAARLWLKFREMELQTPRAKVEGNSPPVGEPFPRD